MIDEQLLVTTKHGDKVEVCTGHMDFWLRGTYLRHDDKWLSMQDENGHYLQVPLALIVEYKKNDK